MVSTFSVRILPQVGYKCIYIWTLLKHGHRIDYMFLLYIADIISVLRPACVSAASKRWTTTVPG